MELPSLTRGAAALAMAFVVAVTPQPRTTIAVWSSGRVIIPPEANTSRPGPLSWEGFEYCLEPLERLRYDDPCSKVTVQAAGQTGKSNIGVVWVSWTICVAPRPMGLCLPSGPKAQSFNSKKLQPVIDATDDLAERVEPEKATNGRGSTTRQKNYPGGSLTLFSAGSVNDLQSESFGALWITESPNFLSEVGSRGSPMTQARTRMDGWDAVGTKELHESTPGEEGICPVSADFEAGDQRRFYLPCPHCDMSHVWEWDDFVVPENPDDEPYIVAPCCGSPIHEVELPALKRFGVDPEAPDAVAGYLPTFPSKNAANPAPGKAVLKADFARFRARSVEGRQPSYHFWQILSPLKTWRGLAKDWRDAKGKPTEESAFRQQKLGLPTEPAVKAPDQASLVEASAKLFVRRGQIPEGTCWLTGVADIQGDRIEWAVHAHGPAIRARIDRGVIEHDPLGLEAWSELAKVFARRWEGPACRPLGLDAVGVDLGGVDGVTPRVYEFVRRRSNCYAIKGASTPPPLPTDFKRIKGKDTRQRTITVQRLLVDTYIFKKFTAYSLGMLVKSAALDPPAPQPGSVLFEDDVSEEDFRQLTAEVFRRPVGAKPGQRGEWVRVEGRANEQLDLDVYCQALAYQKGIQRWDAARWEAEFLARNRFAEETATPLETLWSAPEAQPQPSAVTAPNPGAARRSLLSGRKTL